MVTLNQTDNMMTIRDVSKLLHVHPNTLRRWADKGIIETYRITSRGDRRFMAQDITRFLASMNTQSNIELAENT